MQYGGGMPKAVILGLAGAELTPEERSFFEAHQPLGYILFARNCQNPAQLQKLIRNLKNTVAHSPVPILIDQEGGRVARLRPPYWGTYKPAYHFYEALQEGKDGAMLAYNQAFALGNELAHEGINVNCAPCCDLLFPQTHDVIGDRAYGPNPDIAAALSWATLEGLRAASITPILKHLPGHGRAVADSHVALPVVDTDEETLTQTDFQIFHNICARNKGLKPLWGMTAHIVYSAIDPHNPATQSRTIIEGIIRQHIGFEGVLLSDDLSMKALKGPMTQRAEKSLEAGCDVVLHCNGNRAEMEAVVAACPHLSAPRMMLIKASVAI
jgi:beta-N-acetylhexosaminidase